MENNAIIAGHSVYLPFADSSAELIYKLKLGERVNKELWFRSDDEARKCGFKGNAYVAKLKENNADVLDIIYNLVDEALCQAQLDKHILTGENVRVYLTGIGPRIEGAAYKSFYNNNDTEDIKCTRSITHLHANNMSQDYISQHIARHYKLCRLPPNMHSSSNSSLAAVHLGCQAIEYGHVDLVVIINCSTVKSQDIWFLESQSMLSSKFVQPFGENSKSVLYSEGYCVMVLENNHHRYMRKLRSGICLQSIYTQISASRSNDIAWMSINMLKQMKTLLKNAQILAKDICAIIPHGNGSSVSDKAEENAIIAFMADLIIPVLAYKGQIGYTTTGSGIIDLIIGEHSLRQHELLSPVGENAITNTLSRYVFLNQGVVKHAKQHLLKTGIGMDGSIIAIAMTNNALVRDVDEQ
ncbi:beta-ketoacyl synthase N-terminal-like domain-containing protein [Vagococcus sp. WN89Y]|uniref:beta-ketoacyl synthase N-terminal-like domain-containing protein n=1 Tax=Vagococcus sp. WN89Y TaxID=3457258 RepID=UPI003FCD9F51